MSEHAAAEGVRLSPDQPELPDLPSSSYFRRRGAGILLLLIDITTLAALAAILGEWDWGAMILGALVVMLFAQAGIYRSRFTLSVLNDLPTMVGRFLMAIGLTAILVLTFNYRPGLAPTYKWLIAFLVLVTMRAIGYAFIRYMRSKRLLGKTTLIVGCGLVGRSIALALLRERSCGLEPVGFVDSPPADKLQELPLPLLGDTEELPKLMEEYGAQYVLIAYTHIPESELVAVIRTADRLSAGIAVVPRLYELTPVASGGSEVVSDIPLVRLRRPTFRSPFWRLKRISDATLAGLALLVLSPLLALIALVDRIVDGPGVIFRQQRVGIDGHTIEVLKFRSMRPADDAEADTKWNIKNDDRVSWFGKFLRKSSLDELPQLFNILKGDMSIVGPRPERPHFVERFDLLYPYYGSRHRVPCGLTGWAQIHGLRGDTSIAARARYDNFYIENWSFWLDVKIVLRTVTSLTRGSG